METYLVLILSALCDIKAVKDIHIEFALDTVIVIGGFQCPAGCLCPHKTAKVKGNIVSVCVFVGNKVRAGNHIAHQKTESCVQRTACEFFLFPVFLGQLTSDYLGRI